MRALVAGLAAGLVTLGILGRADAQPVDVAKAKALYDAANSEMSTGKFAEAARDYTGAYEITHDPVLFFKIGDANEKAGKCDAALLYYARYVREAKPEPRFRDMANDRITACGGDPRVLEQAAPVPPPPPPPPTPVPELGAGSGSGSVAAPTEPGTPITMGSEKPQTRVNGRDGEWLMVGGALAFITVGVVLAYSASSSEQDIRDLYVGVAGTRPTYDMSTASRYHDLLDEGHRYQDLSVGAFGIGVGFAVAAAVWFIHDRNVEALAITPVVSAQGAGLNAVGHF